MTNENIEEYKNSMYSSILHHPTNRVEAVIWI